MADEIIDNNARQNNNSKKKRIALIIFGVILSIAFTIGYHYIQYNKLRISTDDAFIEGPIHMVSPKVSGEIKNVYVSDNQKVKAGDLLVEIDTTIFDQKIKEAETSLAVDTQLVSEIVASIEVQSKKKQMSQDSLNGAMSKKDELKAMLNSRDSDLMTRTIRLKQAEIDLNRIKGLYDADLASKDMLDKAKTAYDVALSEQKSAEFIRKQAEMAIVSQEQAINQGESQKKTDSAVINQLESAIKTQKEKINRSKTLINAAKIDLSYTKIYAATDGYISKKNVEVGNYVRTGQPLMAIVPLNDIYIVANYKENQINQIKAGQRVEITVDAYPKKVFIGKVDSIMSGTGAAFSLFPPENATGNFVKVVQRIPVKIVFEKGSISNDLLKIGMSVVPSIIK
jgi:membrane fusion protein (multidrug efflux system)